MQCFGHNPFRARRGLQNNADFANYYGLLCTDLSGCDGKGLVRLRLSPNLRLDYIIQLGPLASLT